MLESATHWVQKILFRYIQLCDPFFLKVNFQIEAPHKAIKYL